MLKGRPATKRTTKTKTRKAPARSRAKKAAGRPGTAGKAEGGAAVRKWISAVKPEHRPIVERIDALIEEVVPGVKRAIKWSMPFYGVPGRGWIVHVASFKNYVTLGFFEGTKLKPEPPEGEGKGMRRFNIHGMEEYDEDRFRSWIQQAASMKGWSKA